MTAGTAGRAPVRVASPGVVLSGVLRAERRALALWAGSVAAVTAMYTAFYPSIGGVKLEVMMDSMPPALIEAMGLEAMASAAGYVAATVYTLVGLIVALVAAIGAGARLIAGQEEDTTLELELGAPVTRGRIYAERLAAVWIVAFVLAATVTGLLMLLSPAMDLGLDLGNLATAGVGYLLYVGTLGTVAFGVGAATGRRGVALGVASGVAVLGYLLAYIGPLAGLAWMEDVSPFGWYTAADPLITGEGWGGFVLLLLFAALVAALGLARFTRRDLTV